MAADPIELLIQIRYTKTTCKGRVTIGHTGTYRKLRRSTQLAYFLSIFLSIFLALLPITHAHADPVSDETQLVSDDTVPPVVSIQISDPDTRTVSGTVPVTMTVDELNPLEYSIYLFNSDDSPVEHAHAIQNPVTSTQLTYTWDTTEVANGDYRIKFSASDQTNITSFDVIVTVLNQGAGPAYPPIDPVLEPIPINQIINPTSPRAQAKRPPQATTDTTGGNQESEKKDVLAARIGDAATATQQAVTPAADTCAQFFGTCWYWSVPATFTVGALSYVAYRYIRRSA